MLNASERACVSGERVRSCVPALKDNASVCVPGEKSVQLMLACTLQCRVPFHWVCGCGEREGGQGEGIAPGGVIAPGMGGGRKGK
jgi:hypothetical protein